MADEHVDVAVIGSGPSGSVCSTFLVKKGYRVAMIERDNLPRFHVGESLLPATQLIWERMGIAERLQHAGHTFKYAGQFRIGRSPNESRLCTTTNHFNNFPRRAIQPRPFAYQVERAVFDKMLQDFAVEQGVELWEKTAVEEVLFDGDRAYGMRLRRKGESTRTVTADFIVDASGRRCLIARQLDAMEPDPEIETSAVFGHFKGVTRDPGFAQGFINGYFIEHGWFWFIPLANDVMSVGLVQNKPATDSWSNNPEEVLLPAINRYRFIQERFTNALQVGRIRGIKDLAYQTKVYCGDGWLSVGDANFFVDPLYSSGVQIAHKTGELGAEIVDEFLKGGRDMRAIQRYHKFIKKYRRNVQEPMRTMYRLMKNYTCIHMFVHSTGKWGKDFNNWFLRYVNCWGSGNFDRYVWSARIMEYSGKALAFFGPPIFRLLGKRGWSRYERNPFTGPPLEIPKSEELLHAPAGETEGPAFRPLTTRMHMHVRREAPAMATVGAAAGDANGAAAS